MCLPRELLTFCTNNSTATVILLQRGFKHISSLSVSKEEGSMLYEDTAANMVRSRLPVPCCKHFSVLDCVRKRNRAFRYLAMQCCVCEDVQSRGLIYKTVRRNLTKSLRANKSRKWFRQIKIRIYKTVRVHLKVISLYKSHSTCHIQP